MLPNWENRPFTITNLLNPAFCGEVIRCCMLEFQKINTDGFPFQMMFLILPIVLNKQFRESLPKKSNKRFVSWVEENQMMKKNLPKTIKDLVPYTKETIMFLMIYKVIEIDDKGNFKVIAKSKKTNVSNEATECYEKAQMLGKILAKAGKSQFVFINLGIKP